jgi:hypothetical protein
MVTFESEWQEFRKQCIDHVGLKPASIDALEVAFKSGMYAMLIAPKKMGDAEFVGAIPRLRQEYELWAFQEHATRMVH